MKAYELIDSKDKWCTGSYFKSISNQRCAVGAISSAYKVALYDVESATTEYEDLNEKLRQLDEIANHSMIYWNDKHSWQEVYDTLKKLDL